MGYYTRYKLEVSGPLDIVEEFKSDFYEDKITAASYGESLKDLTSLDSHYVGELKWYEHNSDMIAISSEYPNLLLELSGEGEESGDIWRAWYRNGKSVRSEARIVFDEPDLSRLPLIETTEFEQTLARKRLLKEELAQLDRDKEEQRNILLAEKEEIEMRLKSLT